MSERFPPLDDAASETALVSGGFDPKSPPPGVDPKSPPPGVDPKSPPPGVPPPNSPPEDVPPPNSSPLISLCRRLVAMVSLTGGVLGEAFEVGELPWDVEETDLFT